MSRRARKGGGTIPAPSFGFRGFYTCISPRGRIKTQENRILDHIDRNPSSADLCNYDWKPLSDALHSCRGEERVGWFLLSLLVGIWCDNHSPMCTTPQWDISKKMWIETRHLLHYFVFLILSCSHTYMFICVLVLSLTFKTTASACKIIYHCTFLIHILVEAEIWKYHVAKHVI